MAQDKQTDAGQAWASARDYGLHLARGGRLPVIPVHGLILGQGEHGVFQTSATYERYWAGDGSYSTTGGFFFGSPAFVVGGLAATAIVNARRKSKAARNAMLQWRETQQSHVVATNQRLLVTSAGRGYLSFWYGGIQEFYPDPEHWSVIMVWPGVEPLRLTGLAAPYLACHVGAMIMPGQWYANPAFARLFGAEAQQIAGAGHPGLPQDSSE